MLSKPLHALCITCSLLLITLLASAQQDLLYSFTVINKGGQNEVNWTFNDNANPSLIKRIGIQRAMDSLGNYATIGHAGVAQKKTNQFVDKKPTAGSNYYRLFIFYKDGQYAFSKSAKIILLPATLSNSGQTAVSFQPSIFVYSNRDGNVNISIADAAKADYTIRFYDAADRFLFEIDKIDKPLLIVDKTNFLHAGWFHYELYKDGKIFEKWKFFIADHQ